MIEEYKKIMRVCDCTFFLTWTLYGYLLVDRSLSRLPLTALQYPDKYEYILWDIYCYTTEINAEAKRKFYIKNGEIVLRRKIKKGVKPYVYGYLKGWAEPSDTKFLRMLMRKLRSVKIQQPPLPMRKTLTAFRRAVGQHGMFWSALVKDLASGAWKAGDDITARYTVSGELQQLLERISATAGLPALIDARDGRYTVSALFAENNAAVLPYIISRLFFPLLPDAVCDTLIYSCMADVNG